jgi:hypothetical protein
MHAALSYVLTAALFVHTVLGCCWHQGRDCESAQAKLSEAATGCKLHHREHSQCPGPCNCRLHCQDTCKAIRLHKTEVTKANLVAPLDLAAAILTTGPGATRPAEIRQALLERTGASGSLRPHLLHQILLI